MCRGHFRLLKYVLGPFSRIRQHLTLICEHRTHTHTEHRCLRNLFQIHHNNSVCIKKRKVAMEMSLLLLSGVSIVCAPPPLVLIIRVMKVITVVVFLTKLPNTHLTVSNNGYEYRERCALLGAMFWPCNPHQNHHCNTAESHKPYTHTHTHTNTCTHNTPNSPFHGQ